MSLKIEDIEICLAETSLEPPQRNEVINVLVKTEEQKKEERSLKKAQKKKKELLIISSGPLLGSVWQVPEGLDPLILVDNVRSAAIDFNLSCKKKANQVTNFEEALTIKPKFFKNYNIKLVSKKEFVRIVEAPAEFIKEQTLEEFTNEAD